MRSVPGVSAQSVLLDMPGVLTSRDHIELTVHQYFKQRLSGFVQQHAGDAVLDHLLSRVRVRCGQNQDPVRRLMQWLSDDQETPLLQEMVGLIWDEACGEGIVQGHIYSDALNMLRNWRAQGVSPHIFSSGSAHWQAQYLRHCPQGDLSALFSRHFGLSVGSRVAATSYRKAAATIGLRPADICFISCSVVALAAARSAGLYALHIARDGFAPDRGFPYIVSFDELAACQIAEAAD